MSFLIKNFFDDDKKNLIYMIDLWCQIEILLLNMLKMLQITGFSRFFVQNPRYFHVPGKSGNPVSIRCFIKYYFDSGVKLKMLFVELF